MDEKVEEPSLADKIKYWLNFFETEKNVRNTVPEEFIKYSDSSDYR